MELSRLKITATETQHSVDGLDSKMKRTEERIGELEDRAIEIRQSEQQGEHRLEKINEQGLRQLGRYNRWAHVRVVRLAERRSKREGLKM